MKKVFHIFICIITIGCSKESFQEEYQFIKEYSGTVTVGGFVGLTERYFKIGETYEGTNLEEGMVTIRIAEHSKLNEDCPNSWCYQEFLNVPIEFLKLVD
ncbi:hypothetical protein [Wenyingzhuangia sp. 2_MG-2023]|uniref:hypothetical protein n=1 Tax=Wenyingzhuangia sp. 2_MG-2023 TaxID=3062639 RepID=UPI0026E230D2|nr:hypothetical protein [Wenyingzhuangia sp. 2_MG-2023]MDO6738882.1 hypothetical protein [Wenyingzhuangia sp. 2_MG-2023]